MRCLSFLEDFKIKKFTRLSPLLHDHLRFPLLPHDIHDVTLHL